MNSTALFSPHHCSKDARLPVQLQRAMAAEAEAAREARAKVKSNLQQHCTKCVSQTQSCLIAGDSRRG